jgi:hypothetical protein
MMSGAMATHNIHECPVKHTDPANCAAKLAWSKLQRRVPCRAIITAQPQYQQAQDIYSGIANMTPQDYASMNAGKT